MTEEQNKLADRLQAMLDQVGHPDYSLRELYEGLKLIVWELRQEREPATEAVLVTALKQARRYVEDRGSFWSQSAMLETIDDALKGKGASHE